MSAAAGSGGRGIHDGGSGIGAAADGAVARSGGNGRAAEAVAEAAAPRPAPLRVDAQRNLEHVLRAAREVFGELGYGAPMEDVARRARVGVGTVYRRFPSKDVLVRRIAAEETARLTEQARTALSQEQDPWAALSRFLRTSVDSGAGRLLPPRILRSDGWDEGALAGDSGAVAGAGSGSGPVSGSGSGDRALRVPQQRQGPYVQEGPVSSAPSAPGGLRLVDDSGAAAAGASAQIRSAGANGEDDAGSAELLDVVGQMVQRAHEAGELRDDVTVGDVLLVIATAAPSLPDAKQQAAASRRLLDILLEGLRPRP